MRGERRLRVFETRLLRRIFGSKRDGVIGEWRKLHNEEHCDVYWLLSIIWVIKSRRMRWVGHVEHMGERRGAYSVLVGKPEESDHNESRGVDGRIILIWIYKTWDGGMVWTDLAQDRNRWRAVVNAAMIHWVP